MGQLWFNFVLVFGTFAYFRIGRKLSSSFQTLLTNNCPSSNATDGYLPNMTMYGLEIPSRTYHMWPTNIPFPCITSQNKKKDKENPRGLYYIKVPKAASSTGAGLALRIAHRYSMRIGMNETCRVHYTHRTAEKLRVVRRLKHESFLWTFVREPSAHRVSAYFFFGVSRQGINHTDENLIKYVRSFRKQLPYISAAVHASGMEAQDQNSSIYSTSLDEVDTTALADEVRQTLNEYNFIGVTERLDESLVVLRLLAGLDEGDMLYMSSKVSGGYDDGKVKGICHKIQPTILSPAAKNFLASDQWHAENAGDFMLYKAADRSLDLTIDHVIGRRKFEKHLVRHRQLVAMAQDYCASRTFFPCSNRGELQPEKSNCYITGSDWGCGYPCLDEFYEEFQQGRISLER